MKDLTVILEDRLGRLADLGELTGNAGIECRPRAVRRYGELDERGAAALHLTC